MATVTLNGEKINLSTPELKVGDDAPVVELCSKDLQDVKVGGKSDFIQVLVAIPSVDTSVCALETKKFNKDMSSDPHVKLSVISMDLPFAMGRFCATEGIDNIGVLSDFRAKEFGKKYGILLEDGAFRGLLARAVFIVGKDGKLLYKQIVPEIRHEPDYDDIKANLAKNHHCCCGSKK